MFGILEVIYLISSKFQSNSTFMPSFDIVNEIDHQEVDNAINNTVKEIATRYDFRGSNTTVEYLKKRNESTS